MGQYNINPKVVERLKMGDWSFGHAGMHCGVGTEECPKTLHHHHDEFCMRPTRAELIAAGINPRYFRMKSRR